jgi:hypothetical protein
MPDERQFELRERLVDQELCRLFLKALEGEMGKSKKDE